MKFKMTGGGMHRTADNQTVNVGDTIESKTDLSKSFSDKFERVPDDAVAEIVPSTQELAPGTPDDEEGGDRNDESTDDRGEDATADFKDSADAGVLVFKSDKKYYVYDAENPGEMFEDGEGLRSKKAVKDFLKSF